MHPEYIKAGLRSRGLLLRGIASELGVREQSVSAVIHRKIRSHRIASHIAELLDQPVQVIFPEYKQ